VTSITARRGLHRSIWTLGIVSLLMDSSSEAIHALLPLFLVSVLGASTVAVGLIEGAAEAITQIVKIFSGTISDAVGRRKPLVLLGYAMAALSKPLFPLATGIGWVFTARFLDRIGKGIRGAPRDALIADLTRPDERGAAYGLRQALDTVGAIAGPAAAMLLMWWLADNFRAVFWIAVIPAVLCVVVLWFGVEEGQIAPRTAKAKGPRLRWSELTRLGRAFWMVVGVGFVMTLARFSEAFLVLRGQNLGLSLAMAPVVMLVMNVAFAATSYPVGKLADRVDRYTLLTIGFVLLIAADLVLAAAKDWKLLMVGVSLWGLHMGFTQGLLAAMVADAAPESRRGTAFGLFYLASGVAMLLASAIAGVLWQEIGPSATFIAGAGFVGLATIVSLFLRRRL
jgi:MFS family permease